MPAPMHPQNFHIAGRRLEQSLDDLDCCCLSRPIWAEQSKALAYLDHQVQPTHRVDWLLSAVTFEQIGTPDCDRHPAIIRVRYKQRIAQVVFALGLPQLCAVYSRSPKVINEFPEITDTYCL